MSTNLPSSAPRSGVMPSLSIMMFLQFFVWGAWYVSMTGFINSAGMSELTGVAYTVAPIAAILSPFFLGLIADRLFSSEKVLGVLHILGGAALIAAPMAARPFELPPMPADAGIFHRLFVHDASAYSHPFILLLLLHMLCYMPTLALSTSLSFHNLTNPEKQFPIIRVLGTIGWIVGNIAVSFLPGKDVSASQFYLAGGAGVALGLYSFFLPHTPPPLAGTKPSIGQILGLDSLSLLKRRSYAVFIVCSFLLCIPLAGYYQQARNYVEEMGAVVNQSATFTMSFGQMSEVLFMLIMPLCFARLGVKWMLLVGMLAWVVRYGLFHLAVDDRVVWMILMGVILHGICYDFFFVTGMIYVDKAAPPTIRGQAQGFLVLVTQGLGLGLGSKIISGLVTQYTTDGVTDWKNVWLMPCVFALGVAILFFLLFKERRPSRAGNPAP
ncbi:MAG: MFS transporter [Phycisphaeraceae bacterium]|nr:MFS transporter [Phycisphaeraceae bacterium]HRJ49775.1 MFS transporter [Phycisphaerales bacterium]